MSKFNIGDSVRVVSSVSAFGGEVGVVNAILATRPYPYVVNVSVEGECESVPFAANELELI